MIVQDIRLEEDRDGPCLAAMVCSETHAFDPFRARYSFPGGDPAWIRPTGDPFVAAFLIPADALGEDLRVDGPVSPRLAESVRSILEIVRTFVPVRWDWRRAWRGAGAAAQVIAAEPASALRPPGVGLFFSGGVDSFHALLTSADGPPRPTHLLFVDGFDLLEGDRTVFRQALEAVRRVAAATQTTSVLVRPNVRGLIESVVPRSLSYGGFMVSSGLALGSLLGTMRFSAGLSWAEKIPYGQHPLLDPLWSTEATEVEHVGSAPRSRKITEVVAGSPLALRHLRVCFEGPPRGLYNCGRCGKCVSTMLALRAAGVSRPPTFPRGPTLADVLRHRPSWTAGRLLREIAPHLRARGDRALAAAVRLSILRGRIGLYADAARRRVRWLVGARRASLP